MAFAGFKISVSGCDHIVKKKIELYRDNYPDVQLFFARKPDADSRLCVLPADMVSGYFADNPERLLPAPVIAFGPASAIALSLAAGCSDYLCSPWTPEEFFERILRCCRNSDIETNDCRLCAESGFLHCIRKNADGGSGAVLSVKLSRSEDILFKTLVRNKGNYLGRGLLADMLGNRGSEGSRAVDMHVSRLRSKISYLYRQSGINPAEGPVRSAAGRGWAIF